MLRIIPYSRIYEVDTRKSSYRWQTARYFCKLYAVYVWIAYIAFVCDLQLVLAYLHSRSEVRNYIFSKKLDTSAKIYGADVLGLLQ